MFSSNRASPQHTQRRRLQQSNCGLQFQNQQLSFASCKSLTSDLGTDMNVLWTVVEDGNGNSTLRGAIDAARTAGSVDWAGFGINTRLEMVGGNAMIVQSCSSCASGASIGGYFLASYDGIEQPARFKIISSTAALSGGRLLGVFEISLALSGSRLSSVPALFAAGPISSSGAPQQHEYYQPENLDLSAGLTTSLGPALAPASGAPSPAVQAPTSAATAAGGAVSPSPAASAPGPSSGGCVLSFAGNSSQLAYAQCQSLSTSSNSASGLRLLWTLGASPTGNGSVLYGALESSSTSQWAGFGLAQNAGQMLNSDAIIVKPCSSCSTGASADKYLLAGYEPNQVVAGTGSLNLLSTQAVNSGGKLQAVFAVALPQSASDLNAGTNVIAATGPTSSGGNLQSHPVSNAYSGTVNLASGAVTVSSGPSDAKVTAHAVLVIVGWGLLLPLGVLFARFKEWGSIWFQLHRAFQTLGYIVGVAGAAIGFDLGEPNGTELEDHHRGIGIAALALFTLNVLALFWRPRPEPTRLRATWQAAHWTLGGVALALAISNVFIGLQVSGEPTKWKILYAVAIGLILLVWIGKLVLDAIRPPKGKARLNKPAPEHTAELGMGASATPNGAANGYHGYNVAR